MTAKQRRLRAQALLAYWRSEHKPEDYNSYEEYYIADCNKMEELGYIWDNVRGGCHWDLREEIGMPELEDWREAEDIFCKMMEG